MGYALEGQTITSWMLDTRSDTLVFHTADNKVMSSTKRYSESEVNECIYAIIALRDRESENK